MHTLDKIRKPVHNRCFGIEIEALGPEGPIARDLLGKYLGMFYVGGDGSIVRSGEYSGFEAVSQPLPYNWLVKEIDAFDRKYRKLTGKPWEENSSCGIHVHVSRKGVSHTRLKRLAEELWAFSRAQCKYLFGREPNDYCRNIGYHSESRYQMINFTNDNTIEFRMFASGNAVWAKECVRRTKLMCEYKGPVTFAKLEELFTRPD